jgi:hypothetical protein
MNALELYIDQENLYSFEGPRGVRNFEQVVKVLGYSDVREFLADNSGALEALLGFVHDWTERNSEWKEALQGELFEDEVDSLEE